jgi:hypothetical protein
VIKVDVKIKCDKYLRIRENTTSEKTSGKREKIEPG